MKTLAAQQDTFQALADPTRLRMVHLLLAVGQPICQCEFVDSLAVSPANISRHAKILLHAGLLREHREGKWVYYDLPDRRAPIVRAVLEGRDAAFKTDEQRFRRRLKLRQGGKCLIGVQNRAFQAEKGGAKT